MINYNYVYTITITITIYIKIFVKRFVSTNRIRNGKYEYSNLHLTESDEILIYIYIRAPLKFKRQAPL